MYLFLLFNKQNSLGFLVLQEKEDNMKRINHRRTWVWTHMANAYLEHRHV